MAKDPAKLLKDGWGEAFTISKEGKNDFTIESQNLNEYENRNPQSKTKKKD
jgi:hypothetical protein